MTNKSPENISCKRRCNYCGSEAPVIWVHGHGQCAACGINVKECCTGDRNSVDLKRKPVSSS